MYAIIKGSVQICMKDRCIRVMKEKQTFGEAAFFNNKFYDYYAKSLDYTTIYKISRIKFLEIIK